MVLGRTSCQTCIPDNRRGGVLHTGSNELGITWRYNDMNHGSHCWTGGSRWTFCSLQVSPRSCEMPTQLARSTEMPWACPLRAKRATTYSPRSWKATKHFGLWPLSEAATACFGTTEWPPDIPVPQASIEFEVADVAAAAEELKDKGYLLIHEARTEPWTQITARLLSPEGLLVAVCYSPSLHDTGESS